MIEIECVNYEKAFSYEKEDVFNFFQAIATNKHFPLNNKSIEIAFLDESRCVQLHQQFFNDATLTDVMTFPDDDEFSGHFGDIAVCPLVAKENSIETGLNFSEEVSLYLVHGYLHLHGLHDKTEFEIEKMRKSEALLMEDIRGKNLFPEFRFSPI